MTTGPEDDFPYDWAAPYRSPAGLQKVNELASFWPKAPKSPMADRLNAATKYVVTHRPESLEWGPFQAIGSDHVDNVRRIKARARAKLERDFEIAGEVQERLFLQAFPNVAG